MYYPNLTPSSGVRYNITGDSTPQIPTRPIVQTLRDVAEAIVPKRIQDLYNSRSCWGQGNDGSGWRS
jgi:hypothetical protein